MSSWNDNLPPYGRLFFARKFTNPDARPARPHLAGLPSPTRMQPCCTTLNVFEHWDAEPARPVIFIKSPSAAAVL
ncbi:hypothetical protein BDZ89DRAFT_507101 [Hymenopellis radicata]|nr:hypothetical protein BDZ89DRAFT_507101 [Hymenopellis radicata]